MTTRRLRRVAAMSEVAPEPRDVRSGKERNLPVRAGSYGSSAGSQPVAAGTDTPCDDDSIERPGRSGEISPMFDEDSCEEVVMAARTSRQLEQMARREALSLVSSKRADRVSREKRLDGLAIAVTAALVQRREIDRTIGARLVEMTEGEGLQLREAIERCGLLSLQEAQRLHSAAVAERDGLVEH